MAGKNNKTAFFLLPLVSNFLPASKKQAIRQEQPVENISKPKIKMVRARGLEPPRVAPPDPKSGASAIPPRPHISCCIIAKISRKKQYNSTYHTDALKYGMIKIEKSANL